MNWIWDGHPSLQEYRFSGRPFSTGTEPNSTLHNFRLNIVIIYVKELGHFDQYNIYMLNIKKHIDQKKHHKLLK
jgi:hypothetical protein